MLTQIIDQNVGGRLRANTVVIILGGRCGEGGSNRSVQPPLRDLIQIDLVQKGME
jgi:hypothetical protein